MGKNKEGGRKPGKCREQMLASKERHGQHCDDIEGYNVIAALSMRLYKQHGDSIEG